MRHVNPGGREITDEYGPCSTGHILLASDRGGSVVRTNRGGSFCSAGSVEFPVSDWYVAEGKARFVARVKEYSKKSFVSEYLLT
jgi:hypothetical protein